MTDRVRQQFGNFRLVTLLGHGGFAEVYLGQHVRLTLQAAIKVLHANLTGSEADHFQHEAETIARLAHPSIVRVLDYDVQDGVPFIVMDYAPGGSMRRRYPKGSLVPLPIIISSVKQVADALHYAHEQKVIHRDVKPENMLLGRRQEVLLSDFGISTISHNTSSLNASAEGTSGTLAYMAPEQIEGHTRSASDQYALGVVVYEWLCGERPFEGSASEVMAQHLSVPPLPLHERVSTISDEIELVVLKALAKDPKHRFASVQDFALALEMASTAASTGSTRPMMVSGFATEARHTTKHHLPAHLTPLIGREQEIVEASAILRRPEVRLVTLTGTGGIGKTRVALQVATQLLDDFPDGVSFIQLAPISDPELVMPTIAQTLDVKESGTLPLMDHLKAFLQDKQVLLILDNFEQILPAAPHLTNLLASCPGLKLLVTSRAVLHVQGEHEFLVPPLAVPELTQLPSTQSLSDYAAVALFLQRAQAVKPTFQMTSSNARSIAEICVRLDGLPLAIELAAARIKLLSPQALLARLGQRLAILTSRAQDAPMRQQTLRNTIEWSYNLLDASEQRLFRRISVFVGGCTLEAVEVVCQALGDERGKAFDRVASLIDKSLVQQMAQEGEELRFTILETLREYALERLQGAGETEEMCESHAAYYLALAEEAEPHLKGAEQIRWFAAIMSEGVLDTSFSHLKGVEQIKWFARLEQEHENLRTALSWLLMRTRMEVQAEEGKEQAERALRLCDSLFWYWYWYGHFREGWSFLEQALTMRKGVDRSLQARTLSAAGGLLWQLDDTERAEAFIGECLALYQELGDTAGVADALLRLGTVARLRSQYALARSRFEEAKTFFQNVGDTWKRGQCLTELARIAIAQGEYDRAHALLEESLDLYQALGDQLSIAWVLHLLACVLFESQSDLARAAALAKQSLALNREADATSFNAYTLGLLAEIHLAQGAQIGARELAEEHVAIFRKVGSGWDTALAFIGLARVLASQGDQAAARDLYQESFTILNKIGNKESIAACLEGLGAIEAVQGQPAWAAQLWGTADALRQHIGTPLPLVYRADYEYAVAAACNQLGEKSFAVAWAQGSAMSPEQAFAAQGLIAFPTPRELP